MAQAVKENTEKEEAAAKERNDRKLAEDQQKEQGELQEIDKELEEGQGSQELNG